MVDVNRLKHRVEEVQNELEKLANDVVWAYTRQHLLGQRIDELRRVRNRLQRARLNLWKAQTETAAANATLSKSPVSSTKIFFYTGVNSRNKSGVSWKIWKIQRTQKTVTVWWGPAEVKGRKIVPSGKLQSKRLVHITTEAASGYELARIENKLRKGYERAPRSR